MKFIPWVLLLCVLVISYGCGNAKSSDISVQVVYAEDHTQCYALVQAGELRGGSCFK